MDPARGRGTGNNSDTSLFLSLIGPLTIWLLSLLNALFLCVTSGVPVTRRLLLVYILSGITAGLASLVFLARLNSAEGDIGEALTLPAIAAVLIGGTSLFGGVGTMLGTLIGALILTLVLNGMNILSIDGNLQALVTGVIIIVSVLLDLILRRKSVV